MTSELVYTGFLTVDGIVDSPGSVREGHPGGGWVFDTPFLPEVYSLKGEELADTTALLFGRRSYDAFSALRVTAAHTPEPLRPPILCVIAWLLWAAGKRALAHAYLREAVAIEPGHVLARAFTVQMGRDRPAWTRE